MPGSMAARLLISLATVGFGLVASVRGGAPVPPPERLRMVEPAAKKAPVARCVGVPEDSCRRRSYCKWVKSHRRRNGVGVPAHCRFRAPWW
jgi:hypothetical protein